MKTRLYATPAVKGLTLIYRRVYPLTLTTLKYFCIKHGDQTFFEIIITFFSKLFPLHVYTYVMGPGSL